MSQANRGEDAFDGVGRPQVNPVFGREVIERQQHVAIFLQTLHGLGVLGAISFQEGVEGLISSGAGRHHPDLMQLLFGCRLQACGQLIEHIGRLVDPTALFSGTGKHLRQGFPEP